MEWSNEMTVKVIEEYERNPTLWDMSSPDHKDREKKSSAWKKLAECMGAEVSEVQRKIHNLRNQWTAEHRKLNAQRSDSGMAGPKTKWPYYDVLSFIRLSLEARRRKSNLAQAALLHLRSKKTEWFKGRRLLQGRGSIRDQAKESGSSTEELAGTSGGRGVKKTSQLEDESPVDQKVIENVVEEEQQLVDDKEDTCLEVKETGISDDHIEKTQNYSSEEGAADSSTKEVGRKVDAMDLAAQIGDEKNKLLEMMSRQFNSTTIPEGSVPPDPKRTGRVPRLTRKRKSEVLDAVEKTPETPVTQQTPPPPANTNTIHPITNALKKVRKETSENPPTPNTSPTASSSTTSTQGRTRRGLQDRKSGGEKDLIEETTSTPEVPEIEFKTEEGTPSTRGKKRGRGKGKPLVEDGDAGNDSETESPIIPAKSRSKARSSSEEDSQNANTESHTSSNANKGRGRGRTIVDNELSTPFGRGKGKGRGIVKEDYSCDNKGRGKQRSDGEKSDDAMNTNITPGSSRGRGKGRVSNEEGISSSLNNSNNSPVSGSGRRGRGKVEGEKEGTSEPEAGSRQRRSLTPVTGDTTLQSEPKRSQRISNSRDGSLDSSSTVKKGKQKTIPEMLKRQESVPMTKAYPSRGGKKEDSDIGFTKTGKKKKKHFKGLSYSFKRKKRRGRGRMGYGRLGFDNSQETDSVVSEEIDVESIDSSSQDVPSEQLSYQGQDGMEDALSETADNDIEMENVETPEADGEADDLEDLNPEEALVNPVHSEVEDIPADEELSDDIDVENIDEDFVDKDKIDEDVDNESHEDNIKSSEICEKVDEGKEATDSTNEESSLKLAVVDNSAEPTVLKNSDETISGVSKDATPINISTEEIKKITTSIEGGDAGMALNEELVKEVLVDNESSSAEGLDKEVKLSEITEVKVTMADSEPDGHVTSKPTEEIVLEENKDTPAGDTLSYASHYSSNLLNDTDCPVAELEHSATPGTEDMLPEESATVAIGEKALEENPTQQSNDESQSVSGENVPIMANEAGSVAVPSEMGITPSQEVICKTSLLSHTSGEPLPSNDPGNRHLGRRRHSVSKRRLDDLGVEGHNSDSSDSLSEARPLGEGVRKSKRLSRNSSPHPLAIAAPRSPEDAGKNQSKPIGTQSAYVTPVSPEERQRYILSPPLTLTQSCQQQGNVLSATPSLTNVLCKCRIKENPVAVGVTGDLYCQAVDSFDGRMIGCCNVVTNQRYLRVSGKIPFMLLCDIHRQRLRRHNCCPCCGLFCTQGIFYECSWDKCGMRHYYHKLCGLVLAGTTLCPHCGAEEPPKEVQLELKLNRKPVVYLKQHQERKEASARMTWSKKVVPEVVVEAESLPENEPNLELRNGRVISAHKLPLGFGREKLQEAIRSINDGKSINIKPSPKGIYWACKQNDLEKLLHVLVHGMNPNVKVKEYGNQTGMHVAAAYGSLAALHVLTLAGATIDMTDTQLMTPLMVGITKEQNNLVHYLIQAGASLMAKTQDGMTCLHLAAKCGNLLACQHILDSGRLSRHAVNMQDEGGWTPLVWASENRFINVVTFLLDRGGNPQLCDVEQNTALHWAAFSGSTHICSMVLDRGCSLRSMNAHGDTPLHIAARQNHIDAVVLLLARGARLDVLNAKCQTPVDCALPDSDVYLQLTLNSKLIEMMQQNNIRTEKILSSDIAGGKEEVPIPCVNGNDDDLLPKDYLYIAENCEASNVIIDRTITSLKWCECEDGCNADHCGCGQLNFQCWYDPDGRLLPDFNYADPPMIFECNRACRCNKLSCNNRVVQHGISAHMQLFKTTEKGWGVRALKTIQKGSYVCEYVGEIITDLEADQRQDDSYLFDLDNKDSETFCIDARAYGNIARFINHLCEANLTPVKVFIDHQDLTFPRIAFFANRDIEADEELGFDYGEKFWIIKYKHFTCNCASEKCKYSSKTIHTTLENYNKRIRELQEMM